MKYKITFKLHLEVLLIAILFSVIFFNFIEKILFNFCFHADIFFSFDFKSTTAYEVFIYILILTVLIAITIIHELIHGIVHKLFGGKVKYTFKVIYAATQEISENKLSLTQFLIVLLSPVTVVTLFSFALPTYLGALVFILNLFGSLGDLFMAFGLMKYPTDSKIIDRSYGYEVTL